MWWVFRHLCWIPINTKYGPACILEVKSTLKYDIVRGVYISAQISLLIVQLLIPSVYLLLLQRNRRRIIGHLQHHGSFGLFSFLRFLRDLKPVIWRVTENRWYLKSCYLVFCFLHVLFWSHNYQFPHEVFWDYNLCGIKVFRNNMLIFKTRLGDQEHFGKWQLRHRLNLEVATNFCMFNFRSLQLDFSSGPAVI